MANERIQRVKAIFAGAVALRGPEREALLSAACQDDVELRREVDSLLKIHDEGNAMHLADSAPSMPSTEASPLTEKPGMRVGSYKLLQQIGEGGFGAVFMAEQERPVRRRVALKIIKLGMDTRQVVARFEAERQALAMMDHPHIARVFDAGATEAGRPYFVMELVKGIPITEYCDTNQLTATERLNLFIPVCNAVQHAHQKGIIHRDIKPSNILVTLHDGKPVPKVIDFGIAKATDARLTEKTLFTEHHALIGTPAYMSPEQAEMSGLDIDTRSDVYSLGVLLYELLTGTTPFSVQELMAAGYGEIQRIIREVDPPKPSTRLSALLSEPRAQATGPFAAVLRPEWPTGEQVAARRRTEPRKLGLLLRGDLDWIVMKCLEKDRTRRYDAASSLATDVHRYLSGEAVVAAPPSRVYRARKFVRRNKGAVFASAAVMLALAVGLVTTLWQKNEAVRLARAESEARHEVEAQKTLVEVERDAADAARERAEAINEFVTTSLQSSDPHSGGAQAMTVTHAMSQALASLDQGDLKDQPATVADLLQTIAQILDGNGKSAEAEAPAQRALTIERELHPGDHPDVANSLNYLANVRESLGRAVEAEPLYVQALEMRQRLFQGDHPDVATSLNNLAFVRQAMGRAAEAEPLYVQTFEMNQRLFKGDHPTVARSLSNLASVRQSLGRAAEAEPLFVQALEMQQRLFKGDHPDVAGGLNNLALVRQALGRAAEAEPLYVQALAMNQRLFSGDHPTVATSLNNLAYVRESLGRAAEAEQLYVQALQMFQRLFKGDHPNVATSLNNLALVRKSLGRAAEAEPLYVQALEMQQRLFKGDHPDVARSLSNLASVRQSLGRAAEAEPLYVQALEMRQRLFQGDHPDVANTMMNLARCLAALDRLPEALARAQEAAEMAARVLSESHPTRKRCDDALAEIKKKLGATGDAAPPQPRASPPPGG